MKRMVILLSALFMILSGCAPNMGPKETGGTILGAGTGALIGSQFGRGPGRMVAVAVGTLAGALIGQGVGQSLDQADRLTMQKNAQYSLEHTQTNQPTTWVNPDTGNSGEITPTRTYKNNEGQYCREYTQTVTVGGREQQGYGTACRQPDGSWLIVR